MKTIMLVFIFCIMLVASGCRSCVLKSIHSAGILPDVTYTSEDEQYDVVIKDDAIEYWLHEVDIKTHCECCWVLRHEECKSTGCLFVNETTSAHVEAEFDGKVLKWQKTEGHNLGRETIVVPFR